MEQFARNIPLLGEVGQKKLNASNVLIVGVGGVGGYALEMLVRSGIGACTIVDMDKIDITNINRQILALHSTIGKRKVDVAVQRITDINPHIAITAYCERYTKDIEEKIFSARYDYCVDAIDSVKDKIDLILACKRHNVNCISALGAGNRLVADFEVNGLARAVRSRLRKEGVESHKTVCAVSNPRIENALTASISYVPSAMGCILAQEVIKDLLCL